MRKDFAYYPGCWLKGTGAEYAASVEALFERLGCSLEELSQWNCCGAMSARAVAPLASFELSARNLRLAAVAGKPLVVPCAVCYGNLRAAQCVGEDADGELAGAARAPGSVEVLHPLEVLSSREALLELREKVCEPLKGFRAACYYGCLVARPPRRSALDSSENPLAMERVLEVLGAETVDWSYKTECCGAALGAPAEAVALDLVGAILTAAEDAGANCLAVACPLCHWNLDIRQFEVSRRLRRKVEMPVFYFTELAAIALDLPGIEKWLKKHLTTVFPLVDEVLGFE